VFADFLAFATPSIDDANVSAEFKKALNFLIQCQEDGQLPPGGECSSASDGVIGSDLEEALAGYIDEENPC